MEQDAAAMDENAGPSLGYSIFEQTVIDNLDYLTMEQRNHHEFCIARFQHMDSQIEVVQN